VLNLIRNAVDAVADLPEARRVIRIVSRFVEPDRVEVGVEDHGSGISDPSRLFAPFFTTKAEGVGLGLSISSSIITAHGGNLWHVATAGGGATFRFSLPVALQVPS
jgi:C4-dicarboxylate-specific signal transduction histidine kinase